MKKFSYVRVVVALSLANSLLLQTGCSVYFAASGSKDPDFTRIQSGTSRLIAEGELGTPIETKAKPEGESALYVYKTGDTASAGRALLYLLGDILTICLAEYIFFPLEISQSGDSHQVAVDYGKDDRVIGVRRIVEQEPKSPL